MTAVRLTGGAAPAPPELEFASGKGAAVPFTIPAPAPGDDRALWLAEFRGAIFEQRRLLDALDSGALELAEVISAREQYDAARARQARAARVLDRLDDADALALMRAAGLTEGDTDDRH